MNMTWPVILSAENDQFVPGEDLLEALLVSGRRLTGETRNHESFNHYRTMPAAGPEFPYGPPSQRFPESDRVVIRQFVEPHHFWIVEYAVRLPKRLSRVCEFSSEHQFEMAVEMAGGKAGCIHCGFRIPKPCKFPFAHSRVTAHNGEMYCSKCRTFFGWSPGNITRTRFPHTRSGREVSAWGYLTWGATWLAMKSQEIVDNGGLFLET